MIVFYGERSRDLQAAIGVVEGFLHLQTKYYDCVVNVVENLSDVDDISVVGGIVVVGDNLNPIPTTFINELDDECVKILYTHGSPGALDQCLEMGFELVNAIEGEDSGPSRVLEALKCHMWKSSITQSESNELESLDLLMSKIKHVRESCMDETQRRKMASDVAQQFYALLGNSDSEND